MSTKITEVLTRFSQLCNEQKKDPLSFSNQSRRNNSLLPEFIEGWKGLESWPKLFGEAAETHSSGEESEVEITNL